MTDLNWELNFEPCVYSDRLLNKLIIINKQAINKINLTEVKKAIYYAKKYHGLQKRQSGEPYYSHPLEVAYMVADYCFTTNIIVTSILHDTIEDTELTKEMIEYIFGTLIADQVEDLTRIKIDRKISSAEMVTFLYLNHKYDLLLIKIFDRLHNIETIKIKSNADVNRIVYETMQYFISSSMYLRHKIPNILDIENQLIELCLQNFPTQFALQAGEVMVFDDNYQLPSLVFQNAEVLT
jgi:(p)ppGpp synthase/HD superfamily hydrolase